MALYKIGVTEAGDAGVDLSWEEKLDDVDAAVLITKCVSPDFFDATLRHKDKLIIHTTVTGYGHSILEPNVPTLYEEFTAIMELVKAGFPMSRIVVRVDPIIPTEKVTNATLLWQDSQTKNCVCSEKSHIFTMIQSVSLAGLISFPKTFT